MNGTKSILDRISNLISEDSKVLEDFNKRIEASNTSKTKAEEEKKEFEQNITDVQTDIDDITKASEVSQRFSDLEEYMPGLEKLGNSLSLINSLKEELDKIPEQIENLENKIKELTDEADNRSKVIKEAEDELAKLDVEISDAKRYQDNLIELIDLAKSGDINKTREEVVETLTHVGFTEKDAISAAKVILFPEDDLIDYFNASQAKKEAEEEELEKAIEIPSIEDEVEETPVENEVEEVQEEIEATEEETILPYVEEEVSDEVVLDNNDEEIKLDPLDYAEEKDLSNIREIIESYNFDSSRFSNEDIDSDEQTIKENLEFIQEKDLNKDFVYNYPNVIADQNLKNKYNYIVNTLEKTEEDIKLSPQILASYTYEDLEKLVSISEQTGIDPKIIPISVS